MKSVFVCHHVQELRCVQECTHYWSTSDIGHKITRTSSAQFSRWCAV